LIDKRRIQVRRRTHVATAAVSGHGEVSHKPATFQDDGTGAVNRATAGSSTGPAIAAFTGIVIDSVDESSDTAVPTMARSRGVFDEVTIRRPQCSMAHNRAAAHILPWRSMMRRPGFKRTIHTVYCIRPTSRVSPEGAIDEHEITVIPNSAAIGAHAPEQLDVLQGEARSSGNVEKPSQAGTAKRYAALAGCFDNDIPRDQDRSDERNRGAASDLNVRLSPNRGTQRRLVGDSRR
jgi:hypothetical protein